jgi:hypothetical protein
MESVGVDKVKGELRSAIMLMKGIGDGPKG